MHKKIFNDKYGQTNAVIEGNKTMFRDIVRLPQNIRPNKASDPTMGIDDKGKIYFTLTTESGKIDIYPKYQIGEVLAVAQSYKSLHDSLYAGEKTNYDPDIVEALRNKRLDQTKGWNNRVSVEPTLMPHHIKITNIKVERLQDISNEDAMKEGVYKYVVPPLHHEYDPYAPWAPNVRPYKWDNDNLKHFCQARYAFGHLKNKIHGEHTWRSNPWVIAYEFEKIK